MGRNGRRGGNDYEVDVAAVLRSATGWQVTTTRSLRGGTQGAADLAFRRPDAADHDPWLPHMAGWVWECKSVRKLSVPKWLRQARDAAAEVAAPWWLVVHDVYRAPILASSVYLAAGMLHDYLEHGRPTTDHDPTLRHYVRLDLGAFLEVAHPGPPTR